MDLEEQRIKVDPQEVPAYTECNMCGGDIYMGEEYFKFEGDTLCEKCFDEIQENEKRECTRIAGEEYDN